jgi:oligopeptide/dipeptide ABC transporter ATP-binding protein
MSLVIDRLSVFRSGTYLVKDVFLKVERGERVAVVGESGSGKSITALSVLKLLPEGFKASGTISVDGIDVLSLKGKALRKLRWAKVSMIFQDPSASLNPLIRVKEQVGEPLRHHFGLKGKELEEKVVELLKLAEVPQAEEKKDAYPHHLSGGMKQRVAIAMAIACKPGYILADEPTTALDVTVQARILKLLERVSSMGTGVVLITHDISIVSAFAEKLFIMYAGYTVEAGKTKEVLEQPLHPYTKALIECSPEVSGTGKRKLPSIPGRVPHPGEEVRGCPFHPRCQVAVKECGEVVPALSTVKGRLVRCHLNNLLTV